MRQMKRPEETIAKRIRVVGLFYRSTFRVVDLPNLENALDDILVAGGVIKDDSFKYIYSHDGSRVFGGSKYPRTEVLIYEEVI